MSGGGEQEAYRGCGYSSSSAADGSSGGGGLVQDTEEDTGKLHLRSRARNKEES